MIVTSNAIKIRDSDLTYQIANKCLNVCDPVEMIKTNKHDSYHPPAVLLIGSAHKRKEKKEKNKEKKMALTEPTSHRTASKC